MNKRYRVGFEDGVKCSLVDEYPDFFPIVDTLLFGYGQIVAFAISDYDAQQLVNRLNVMNDFEKTLPSVPT